MRSHSWRVDWGMFTVSDSDMLSPVNTSPGTKERTDSLVPPISMRCRCYGKYGFGAITIVGEADPSVSRL